MLIDNDLKLVLADLELCLDETVGGILVGHETNDEDKVDESFGQYSRTRRMLDLGYKMLIDGKLEKWDWQLAADKGWLCDMDWGWFKDDLEKAGVNKEEHDKKWKAG
jgi:hypothetical protein